MQQPCSRCGYISDRPARFCRQCGSPMFNESEVSSAATRNYAPQQAYGNQPDGYQPYAAGRPLDEQAPDTSPFYRPPVVHQYPAPQYQIPAGERQPSNWGKWVLIGLAIFLLFSVLAGGAIFWLVRSPLEKAAEERAGSVTIPVPAIPEIPPIPGIPTVPDASSSDTVGKLESFKYPEAKVMKSHKDSFTETMTMVADDNLETVKEFYDEKFNETFKNSPTSITSEDDQKVTYLSLSRPMLTIILKPQGGDQDKTQIFISRTNLPIPENLIPKIDIRRN